MKKIFFASLCVVLLVSCSNKEGQLKLVILNNKLKTYDMYSDKDTFNLIKYKLTNTSDNCYYINTSFYKFESLCMSNNDGILFYRIYDSKNKEQCEYGTVIYDRPQEFINYENIKRIKVDNDCKLRNCKNLGVDFKKGFFINPNESIYFETYSKVTEKKDNTFKNISITASIEKKKKYYADFFIPCDSSKIKKFLSWEDLSNIKEKNAVIFHGIIYSNNKVPLEVLE